MNEIHVNDYEVVLPTGEIDLSSVSAAQLRKALEKSEAKEKARKARKKAAYELKRDSIVTELSIEAQELSQALKAFKIKVQKSVDEQAVELAEYGGIRSNSKGGFSIKSHNNEFRIKRTRETNPSWDERSNKAVELIKNFLNDAVKKRAEKEFNLIMSFLEKNKAGDLEYQKVMILLSREDNYDDPRWKEGLRLLKESYEVVLKGFGYYFEAKDNEGSYQTIGLNFSSL